MLWKQTEDTIYPSKQFRGKMKRTQACLGFSFLIFCVAIRITYSIYGIKLLIISLLKLLTIYLNYNFTKMWSTLKDSISVQDKLLWLYNKHPEILPTSTSLLPSSSSHYYHYLYQHHHHHPIIIIITIILTTITIIDSTVTPSCHL